MTNTEFRRIQKDARFADKTWNASYLLGTSVGQFCSHFRAPHSSSLNVWQMGKNITETGEFQRKIFTNVSSTFHSANTFKLGCHPTPTNSLQVNAKALERSKASSLTFPTFFRSCCMQKQFLEMQLVPTSVRLLLER